MAIDATTKAQFWPNAADLWLKAIAYDTVLAMKQRAPEAVRRFSVRHWRRLFLCVPGVLVRHACTWRLRLPVSWPHQKASLALRAGLSPGQTR